MSDDLVVRRGGRPADPTVAHGPPRRSFSSTGSDFLERRAGQPALRERAPAEHEQAAAAFGDEVGGHGQLRAREEVALDVGDDDRVVGDTDLLARVGKPVVSAAARPPPA